MIDLVDAADRPIGLVPRGEALDLGANFRTVHVFVFDSQKRLLLQRLAPTRDRHPGRWGSSVAAYLHAGESYDAAARRRLREELGLSARLHRVGRITMRDQRSLKFVGLFTCRSDVAEIEEPDHIAELRYWPAHVLSHETAHARDAFTPTFLELYRFARRRGLFRTTAN